MKKLQIYMIFLHYLFFIHNSLVMKLLGIEAKLLSLGVFICGKK